MRYVQNNLDRRYLFLYDLRPFYSLATLCLHIARVVSILKQTESLIILFGWHRLHTAEVAINSTSKVKVRNKCWNERNFPSQKLLYSFSPSAVNLVINTNLGHDKNSSNGELINFHWVGCHLTSSYVRREPNSHIKELNQKVTEMIVAIIIIITCFIGIRVVICLWNFAPMTEQQHQHRCRYRLSIHSWPFSNHSPNNGYAANTFAFRK